MKHYEIVFDGEPGHIAPRLVEVENGEGLSIRVGTWADRGDGTWSLSIPRFDLNVMAAEAHADSHKWWHDEDGNRIERDKGTLLMLMVSELAEALEGERKGLMDDKLPHRLMAEVELADAIIRIGDYAAAYGYDIQGAYDEKRAYNASREDHVREIESRAVVGGKRAF